MKYDGPKWCVAVARDPKAQYGEGLACFLYDGELEACFPVITGSTEPDPKVIGGLQPPIYWKIREYIKRRNHPNKNRGSQTMARITPLLEEEENEYPNRTFGWLEDTSYPFMAHAGSRRPKSSTGCTACVEDFEGFTAFWNVVFYHANINGYEPIQVTRDLDSEIMKDRDLLCTFLDETFEEMCKTVWPCEENEEEETSLSSDF